MAFRVNIGSHVFLCRVDDLQAGLHTLSALQLQLLYVVSRIRRKECHEKQSSLDLSLPKPVLDPVYQVVIKMANN